MISQLELGGIFEYSINKFSVEIGGGVVMPIHDYGSGYAIRAGGRYYTKSGVYFNLVAFYRNMRYSHRNYYSSTNTDFSEEIGEPFQYRTSPANGGADRSWERHCSEKKQVMAFEFLIGKRTSWFDGVPVDAYIGLGYRYKYKQQEVSSDKIGDVKVYYSPPINETIQGFVPTFHLGFQIEIPIIKRKD